MNTLYCKDGLEIQWLDLTSKLKDTDMINATIENPVTITFDEVPPPLVEQIPFGRRNNYHLLTETAGKKKFYISSTDEVELDYTLSEIAINARGGSLEDGWNPDSGDLYYSNDALNPGYASKNLIYFTENYENRLGVSVVDSFRTCLFSGNGLYVNKVYQRYWGYCGNKLTSSSPVMLASGGYTYIAKFNTNRYDYLGNIVNDFGICIISSPEKIVTGKQYKCLTTFEQFNSIYNNEDETNWINIKYSVYENNINTLVYKIDSPEDFNSLIISGKSYSSLSTTQKAFISLIELEGAINNSSKVKEKGVGPMIGAVDSGMVAIYATPASKGDNKMKELARQLWTKDMVKSIKNSLFDVKDAILNMSLMPIDLSKAESVTGDDVLGNEEPVVLNGVTIGGAFGINTVDMNKVNNQFIKILWKPLKFDGRTNTYLDSSPYSRARLELPYSGSWEINIDDFLGAYIRMTMIVDLFNGDILYEVYRSKEEDSPQTSWNLLYRFTGNMMYAIPTTSGGYGEMWTGFVSTVGKAVL